MLLVLLMHGAALAHANLVRAEPPASANLAQPPVSIQLWFSERPEVKLTQVQVFDAQRREVQQGAPLAAGDDPLSLTEPLQPDLPRGVYTVSWKTTSSVDGHVTAGAYAFGVGVVPSPADLPAASLNQQPAPSPVSVAIRWLAYLSAVGLLGLVLFGWLVLDPAPALGPSAALQPRLRRLEARLARGAGGLAWLLVAAVFAGLLDQARLSGGSLSAASLQATLGAGLGQNLLARLALAIAALAVILLRSRTVGLPALSPDRSLGAAAAQSLPLTSAGEHLPRAMLAAVLLGELLLFALNSHAQAVPNAPELALVNDWLHLVVAGIWVGGLVALLLALVPEAGSRLKPSAGLRPMDVADNQLFGPLVIGFSRVALISAVGLAVTGFYQALVHVGSLENAVDTGYGRALLGKTAIFLLALLLAAFHRWQLVPALKDPSRAAATRARRFLSRTLPLEGGLVALLLAVTGLLTSLPPANAIGPNAQVRTLGGTRVLFEVVPLRIGPNLFQVTLTSRGKPVDDAQKVELRLTMLDMDMGQSVIDLQPRGEGVYAAEGDTMSMGGHWQIELLLRLPGQLDQRTTFDLGVKT